MNKQELKEQVKDYLAIEGVHDARIALKAVLRYIDQLDEPEPVIYAENERITENVEVPQFVANWYESNKEDLENNIETLVWNSRSDECRPITKWMLDKTNKPIGTLIKMKEGYTIEPPKTLQVTIKNYDRTVFKTELPEYEAMKLIDEWKKDVE